MLESQKIQIEQSEIRERLNGLLAKETLTAEEAEQQAKLQTEYNALEARYRTAAIVEAGNGTATESAETDKPADGEAAELRELRGKAKLSRYLSAAAKGGALDGAELELSQHEVRAEGAGVMVPFSVLAGEREERADSATTLPARPTAAGQQAERDFIGRVFEGSVGDYLGVETIGVERGTASYYVLSDGVAVEAKASGSRKDAEAATITGVVLSPKRLTAGYQLSVEDMARSAGYEEALRRDLGAAISRERDNLIINGSGQAPQPQGLEVALANPADPAAEANYAEWVKAVAGGVDGLYAGHLREVKALVPVAGYQPCGFPLFTTNGDYSAADYLADHSGGFMASPNSWQNPKRTTSRMAYLCRTWRGFDECRKCRCGNVARVWR